MADAGCLGLLIPALLVRISADRRRLALSGKYRSTEVPGERRTKLRNWLARNASIVLRQRRNTVGNIVVVGTVKLIGSLIAGAIVLQRPQHRSADDKQGNRAPAGQNLPRQPRHARVLCSQAEVLGLLH
ncbi:hypothetical protein ACVIHF_002330 [Bradyrhizobium sp. USDA 4506]